MISTREKIDAALKILEEESTSLEKAKSAIKLLSGANHMIDKYLERVEKVLGTLEAMSDGDVVELSAEGLPESTDKEKKRKKALILFIKTWKDLKSEVQRVRAEFDKSQNQSSKGQAQSTARLMIGAKGAFGLVTVAAIVIVGGFSYFNSKKSSTVELVSSPSPAASKTKVIEYQGKKIALSEVEIRNGNDCQAAHYHALDHTTATALDGSKVSDPGGCGFGKVSETQVVEI